MVKIQAQQITVKIKRSKQKKNFIAVNQKPSVQIKECALPWLPPALPLWLPVAAYANLSHAN